MFCAPGNVGGNTWCYRVEGARARPTPWVIVRCGRDDFCKSAWDTIWWGSVHSRSCVIILVIILRGSDTGNSRGHTRSTCHQLKNDFQQLLGWQLWTLNICWKCKASPESLKHFGGERRSPIFTGEASGILSVGKSGRIFGFLPFMLRFEDMDWGIMAGSIPWLSLHLSKPLLCGG